MAWTKTQKNGYDIYTESALVLDDNESASAEVVTVTSVFPDGINWEDTKFPMTVDMTTASGAAVVCDAILQTSSTGTISDDVMGASSATPNYSIEVDATDVWAPYARFALNTAATDLTDGAGRCTISFAHKPSKPNSEGLSGSDIGGDGTTGVGPDPS